MHTLSFSSSSILSYQFDHIVQKNSSEQVKPCAINHTTAQPHHIKLRPCIHLILMPFSSSSSTLSCNFDHLVEHNAMNPIRPYWSYWSNISCILSYQYEGWWLWCNGYRPVLRIQFITRIQFTIYRSNIYHSIKLGSCIQHPAPDQKLVGVSDKTKRHT